MTSTRARSFGILSVLSLCVAGFVPVSAHAQSQFSEKAQLGFRAMFCSVLASMDPDNAEIQFQRDFRDQGEVLLKSYFEDLRNQNVGTMIVGPKIKLLDNLTRDNPADYKTQMVWMQTKRGIIGRFLSDWRTEEATGVDRREWKMAWVDRQLSEMGCIDDA